MYVYIVFFPLQPQKKQRKKKKENKNSDISKETLDISEETVVNKHFFFNTPPPLPLPLPPSPSPLHHSPSPPHPQSPSTLHLPLPLWHPGMGRITRIYRGVDWFPHTSTSKKKLLYTGTLVLEWHSNTLPPSLECTSSQRDWWAHRRRSGSCGPTRAEEGRGLESIGPFEETSKILTNKLIWLD